LATARGFSSGAGAEQDDADNEDGGAEPSEVSGIGYLDSDPPL
jgi:hypothetical protein